MRRLDALLLISVLVPMHLAAQDTFSIVAVDTVTGEIGSAGASCVGGGVGAFILSDVIEGIGAIHTQASYLSSNQQTAHTRMVLGDSPQQIIDYMVAHDAQNNPTIRQYGVVDLRRRGESAAYTGVNCLDYKNHATGPGYSVQGNILLGQIIIDTIRNTFLRTRGPLADRMMTALEAAKIIGADTRCASRNTSSQSSFIKVVRIGDGATPYLQQVVGNSAVGVDPIGTLRTLFDRWKDSLRLRTDPFLSQLSVSPETLLANGAAQALLTIVPKNNSDTLLPSGRTILLRHSGSGTISSVTDSGNGRYSALLTAPSVAGTDTIRARVVAGSDTVGIFWARVVQYTPSLQTEESHATTPDALVLLQNFPNPFNPSSRIRYGIPREARVTLTLLDILGRTVRTLVHAVQQAGYHEVTLDVSELPTGVYFYHLQTETGSLTRKLVVLR